MKQRTLDFYGMRAEMHGMRKIDLHRHLSGAVRYATILELAQTTPSYLLAAAPTLQRLLSVDNSVQLQRLMAVEAPVRSLASFISPQKGLRPWHILPYLIQHTEIAARLAYEALEDAAADGVVYVELRVSPYGALPGSPLTLGDFLSGLRTGLARAQDRHGIRGAIILSLIRDTLTKFTQSERKRYYDRVLSVAEQFRGDPVVGFDLAGTERLGTLALFRDFFVEAKRLGFGVTIHAGEGEEPDRIREAIQILGANRLGHAVTLANEASLIELVKTHDVVVEQCVTSNVMTRVVAKVDAHPLPILLASGVKVVLCTDDPSIFNTSLTDEYERAVVELGIQPKQLEQMNAWAYQARFGKPGVLSSC